jgi:hypothetical protein
MNTKQFKWHDWLVFVVFFLIMGTGPGYAWRMVHERNPSPAHYVMMPPESLTIADLSHEIGKGREFWIPVNDETMLHFLPLKGARFQMAIRHEPREGGGNRGS